MPCKFVLADNLYKYDSGAFIIGEFVMEEIWKDIPGYEGKYQASTLGRIRSLDHYSEEFINNGVPCRQFRSGKIMKGTPDEDGYLDIALHVSKGKYKYYKVHRLIALTFIPTSDTSLQIDHLNCVKDDNRVENLEWVTCKDNINRAWEAGRCHVPPRSVTHKAKLRVLASLNNGRPCKCIEDNICFLSILKACKHYNISENVLRRCLIQQVSCPCPDGRPLTFVFIDKDSEEYKKFAQDFVVQSL